MARDGSGNYVLPTGQPVVTGSTISSSTFNTLTNDLATALTGSMTRDGQGVPTANIPFGGFKITNLGNGSSSTDSINYGQVQGLISADRKSSNRVINGGMVIDQRNEGASLTYTNGSTIQYGVDQWYGWVTGANCTGARVAGSGRDQYRYQFTGAASVTAVGFGQKIEQADTYDLVSQTVTLGVDLAMSAGGTVTWTIYRPSATANTFGTAAPPGGTRTSEATGTFTATSTVTRFTTTLTLSSSANQGLEIVFSIGALAAAATWTIGNVQLELGSSASAFERRGYADELQRCQRFYAKSYAPGTAPGTVVTSGVSIDRIPTGTASPTGLNTSLPVTMFRTPSMVWYSSATLNASSNVRDTTTAADVPTTGTTAESPRTTGYPTMNASQTALDIIHAHWTASGTIP